VTRILYVDIPAPCAFITSNQRLHWREKAARTASWRKAAAGAIREGVRPFTGRVRVLATIHKPRGGRWDPNNWADTSKACVDGLVDAGLLADDDHTRVLGPDHRAGIPGPARIVLTIEEVA
jgi:hypothetical protein